MSILDIYNNSDKPNVQKARQIPGQRTNFFDREHTFTKDGFVTNEKQGDEEFTNNALNFFDTELGTLTPLPDGTILMKWSEKKPYYNPGSPPQ